jgi:hypothetical protein
VFDNLKMASGIVAGAVLNTPTNTFGSNYITWQGGAGVTSTLGGGCRRDADAQLVVERCEVAVPLNPQQRNPRTGRVLTHSPVSCSPCGVRGDAISRCEFVERIARTPLGA